MFLLIKTLFSATTINKISDKGLTASHPPTTDCWPTGEGLIPSPIIKVSGWNVNGFRARLADGCLASFM
jgi:exodeoxyribonuclease III